MSSEEHQKSQLSGTIDQRNDQPCSYSSNNAASGVCPTSGMASSTVELEEFNIDEVLRDSDSRLSMAQSASDNINCGGSDIEASLDSDRGSILSSASGVNEDQSSDRVFDEPTVGSTDCRKSDDEEHTQYTKSGLCPCTSCTENDVYAMCLALGARHNLTWVTLVDALKMINVIFKRDVVSSNKYALVKHASSVTVDPTYHFYCNDCEQNLEAKVKTKVGEMKGIECGKCKKKYNHNQLPEFFLSLDLGHQIKSLLQRPGIAHIAQTYRFERTNNSDCLSDLYDGEVYQNLSAPGNILSNPLNHSLTFGTDGVSLGKSSSLSVWPIFAYINELPPELRTKHMFLAGIWVGSKDPIMRLFLQAFVKQCQDLEEKGIDIEDPLSGEKFNCKIIVICGILDAVARCKVLNMSSFHAYYGCTQCYQRTENTSKGRRYTVSTKPAQLRTNESIVADMLQAYDNRNNRDVKERVVRGVKGPSPLMILNHLDLAKGFSVDFMHSVVLGNIRYHTELLLSSFGKEYYIGATKSLELLNSRLMSINPPKCITRTPRAMKQWKLWKASEWRSWLLFYCIVCLYRILPPKYLEHLAMLSTAIYNMVNKPIHKGDLQSYRIILAKYVYLVQTYFGELAAVYNFHQLLHLVDGVSNWGPLFTHSAFDFEGENQQLMQMHTSPGSVAQQLSLRYQLYNHLPNLCEKLASSPEIVDFISNMTGKQLLSVIRSSGVVLVGKGEPSELTMEELRCFNFEENYCMNVKKFEKMFYKKLRFTTAKYCVNKKNDDSVVYLVGGNKCRIESIVKFENEALNNDVVLLVRNLRLQKEPLVKTKNVCLSHIQKVVGFGSMLAIQPELIEGQCVYMNVDHGTFVSAVPIGCYRD